MTDLNLNQNLTVWLKNMLYNNYIKILHSLKNSLKNFRTTVPIKQQGILFATQCNIE